MITISESSSLDLVCAGADLRAARLIGIFSDDDEAR